MHRPRSLPACLALGCSLAPLAPLDELTEPTSLLAAVALTLLAFLVVSRRARSLTRGSLRAIGRAIEAWPALWFFWIPACVFVVAIGASTGCPRRWPMSSEVNLMFAALKSQLDAACVDGRCLAAEPTGDAQWFRTREPDARGQAPQALPQVLRAIEFRAPIATVECRYAVARSGPDDLDRPWSALPAFTQGATIFGTDRSPEEPWYYLRALCNPKRSHDLRDWVEWHTRFDNSQVWMVVE